MQTRTHSTARNWEYSNTVRNWKNYSTARNWKNSSTARNGNILATSNFRDLEITVVEGVVHGRHEVEADPDNWSRIL